MYCFHCGEKVEYEQKFCHHCGTDLTNKNDAQNEGASTAEPGIDRFSDQVKGTFFQATEKVNQMVGETGRVEVNLKEVFSAVFKKHTKDEAETLFISGTKT